jgi:hypothetical protein
MKLAPAVLALAAIVLLAPDVRSAEPSPVVVELFTSQGCSSCPPADAYLGELARRPGVLALSLHVDYWNYIGWTDPFASKQATHRQKEYSRRLSQKYVYTPEIVVDGAAGEVGSNRKGCERLIAEAKAHRSAEPGLTVERGSDGATAHVGTAASERGPATLWLVRYDEERTTRVLQGENGGRELKNYNVVREWRELATWTGETLDVPVPKGGEGHAAALILQRDGAGPILAARLLPPQD